MSIFVSSIYCHDSLCEDGDYFFSSVCKTYENDDKMIEAEYLMHLRPEQINYKILPTCNLLITNNVPDHCDLSGFEASPLSKLCIFKVS